MRWRRNHQRRRRSPLRSMREVATFLPAMGSLLRSFSGTPSALAAPAHVTMQHPSQKRRPSRCIVLCFARPSRDARNSPSCVSFVDRDPDTPEPISTWSVNHFRATRLGHVQLQCSRATCGHDYPSEKLMQVLHIQLLQRADEIGWGLEHLAGNRDGGLSR